MCSFRLTLWCFSGGLSYVCSVSLWQDLLAAILSINLQQCLSAADHKLLYKCYILQPAAAMRHRSRHWAELPPRGLWTLPSPGLPCPYRGQTCEDTQARGVTRMQQAGSLCIRHFREFVLRNSIHIRMIRPMELALCFFLLSLWLLAKKKG